MTLLLIPKAFDGSDCSPEADQIPHSAPCPLGAGPLPLPSCPPPAILSVLHQTASAHRGPVQLPTASRMLPCGQPVRQADPRRRGVSVLLEEIRNSTHKLTDRLILDDSEHSTVIVTESRLRAEGKALL